MASNGTNRTSGEGGAGATEVLERETPNAPAAQDEAAAQDETNAEPEGAQPANEDATEPGARLASPDAARRRGRRLLRRRVAVGALAAVAAAGVAGSVGFGLAWSSLNERQAGAAQVRAAASHFVLALTNFGAKTVDRDFAEVTSEATGTFAKQADAFFGSSIRQDLENAKATSSGQIRSLFVQTSRGDRASVYAVVDQTYSNDKITAPQSDVLRLVVYLSQVSGRWKVSNVTVLEGPQSPPGGSPTGAAMGSAAGSAPAGG